MKVKLAEALLRRKELNLKINQIDVFRKADIYETKVKRVNVTESVDDLTAAVPKLTLQEVTAEYDYYARQLRLVDAAIQQANWTTEIDVGNDVMKDFEPKVEGKSKKK